MKNKVDWIKGWGSFKSKTEVSVNLEDGSKETYSAKNIIIATGSEPIPFGDVEFDEKVIVSSTGALETEKIPKEMLVIGGGIVGLEMGSVYARLGTTVTVLEYANRIAGGCDEEISGVLATSLTR